VTALERGLRGLPGIHSASVTLLPPRAVVLYDPSLQAPDSIARAVGSLGYGATPLTASVATAATGTPAVARRESVRLEVSGMSCASCVSALERGLRALPGVHSASVMLLPPRAVVVHDPALQSVDSLVTAVGELGYGATPLPAARIAAATAVPAAAAGRPSVRLRVRGMSCASCVAGIERGVRALPGVLSAAVSLVTAEATVQYDPAVVEPRQVRPCSV
jgi:Cu+-exporting ATPase